MTSDDQELAESIKEMARVLRDMHAGKAYAALCRRLDFDYTPEVKVIAISMFGCGVHLGISEGLKAALNGSEDGDGEAT